MAETTQLWTMYEQGRAYQSSSGLAKNLPKYVQFYEGNQWPAPTKSTRGLPRPVFNIIEMICRNKQAAILSAPVRIIYKADDPSADVGKFNHFSDYIVKEIGQSGLDKEAIEDGCKKGTYVYHYYWDAEGKGKDGVKEGALRCEIIDPLNIFFSNPAERDEQKQKWILIASREDVDAVREKCDRNVDKDLITADENDSRYGEKEQEGNKLCTVLTRYFRRDGEVYCEKATRTVILNKPFPITPNVTAAQKTITGEEDAPNNSLPDNDEDTLIDHDKIYLYPIVVGNYKKRDKCIYGRGEVEGIIPNQKIINFLVAMATLNAQDTAWGKYIVMPNALQGQEISNEPAQVLVDYSGTGNGIRKMTEQAMQSMPLTLVDTITQLTRVCTGASEVMTGEVIGANLSGSAIAQLQSQAQQPVEELRDIFWLVKEKQGRVLEQFYKHYYAARDFSYEEEGEEDGETNTVTDIFDGEAYMSVRFDVVVEATAGTKASAAGDINALDNLLQRGLISVETYINSYPSDALSNRNELLKLVQEERKSQVNELARQVEQLSAQLQQASSVIENQKKTVDGVVSLIRENNQLKAMLVQLRQEYTEKINLGNARIRQMDQRLAETTADATEFAQTIMQSPQNPVVIN